MTAQLGDETADRLVERLQSETDGSMRGAVRYVDTSHTIVYLRDDIAAQYTDSEIDEAAADLELEAFGDKRLESMYQMGALEGTIRWFEDGLLVHFPYDERSGVAVSFDHDVSPTVRSLMETGLNTIGENGS